MMNDHALLERARTKMKGVLRDLGIEFEQERSCMDAIQYNHYLANLLDEGRIHGQREDEGETVSLPIPGVQSEEDVGEPSGGSGSSSEDTW
jgi:hypothetical protein